MTVLTAIPTVLIGADLTKSLLGSQEETGLVSLIELGETAPSLWSCLCQGNYSMVCVHTVRWTHPHATVTPVSYQEPQ